MNSLAIITLLGVLPLLTFGDNPIFTELANLKASQTAALEKVENFTKNPAGTKRQTKVF